MPGIDSLLVNLVHRINAFAERNWLQPGDSIAELLDPDFDDFLLKTNHGIAVTSPNGFFYVSKSVGLMLGYPLETIYAKGPGFFQEVIAASDKPLVENMVTKSVNVLNTQKMPPGNVRVSFDYKIVSGTGEIKRVYQHTLTSAVVQENKYYTIIILMDLTGLKSSPRLNYRVSYLNPDEQFQTISEGTVSQPPPYNFTTRETNILKYLAAGHRMEEIAEDISISLLTLKKHRQNILKKSGASNMVSLIREGLHDGWIDIDNEGPGKITS